MMAPQEGQREQSSTAKGEGEDEKSGLLDWGKWGRERGGVRCSFLPLVDECEPSLGRGGIAHHLAAD